MRGVAVAVCLCALVFATPLDAAEGDLDAGFGNGGSVAAPTTGVPDGSGVVVRDDGTIVSAVIDDDGLKLLRYDASGTPDPTFGTGGVVTTAAPGTYLTELAGQPDGKLVVVATAPPGFAIARYEADGDPDQSFGMGGVAVVPDCGSENFLLSDLVLAPDGSIILGISAVDGTPGVAHACVVRLDGAGAPDPTFGAGGVVTLDHAMVHAVALQGEKVLVGGALVDGSSATGAVMRLNAGGDRDGGFGDGGVFTRALAPFVTALRLGVAGDVLVLGYEGQVVRLDANGVLDDSFGIDGVASMPPPPDPDQVYATGLAVQQDGRIVVAMTLTEWFSPPSGSVSVVRLARYDVDGALDATFGSAGIAPSVPGRLGGFVLPSDGKPVLSARTEPTVVNPTAHLQVARHLGFTLPCPASAASGCRGSIAPKAGRLRMDAPSPKAKLQWSWQKGAATDVGDFADPLGGDDYVLCFYDESAGSTLASGAVIPGGGTCKGRPCWKSLGTKGLAYRDSQRRRFGIAGITLKTGAAGKAKVSIKGQGPSLPVPGLPAPLPLRVQLFAEDGACFESVFSSNGTTRNDAARYQGKSD